MLNKENNGHYENELKNRIANNLMNKGYREQLNGTKDLQTGKNIEENFNIFLKNFLKTQGYYSATGKTAGIYDLFVWSLQVPTQYNVDLPETKVTTIIFLEEVVTMGWEEYASFGKVYPGGWATKEELYAVGKAYDTTSENFKVSYLKHESRHFSDYKEYSLLTGADLEYRAKLTELIYAEEIFYILIESFIRNAENKGRNPHALVVTR